MVREYSWRLRVRSYEGDAWGFVPTSGVLRYLEQTAVAAAADAGYGSEFHARHGSAWVIRRMTLLMQAPARQGDELEIVTWISHFGRVRGGREYRVRNVATGTLLYTGIAEWVYLNRQTRAPMAIPSQVAAGFSAPGTPLGEYNPPQVELGATQARLTLQRTVEWHEIDSMGHVNNATYADWLDDAFRLALKEGGLDASEWSRHGPHIRGEYYNLNYKRAALPGDMVHLTTTVGNASNHRYAVQQKVTSADGAEILEANSIHRET